MVRLVWPAQGVVWRVAIAFALVIAFVGGYRLSAYFQSKVIVSAAGVPPTDFAVPLPEGETRITITDPQQNNAQLALFVIKREGNSFKGVPESERVIEPRSAVSFAVAQVGNACRASDTDSRRVSSKPPGVFS